MFFVCFSLGNIVLAFRAPAFLWLGLVASIGAIGFGWLVFRSAKSRPRLNIFPDRIEFVPGKLGRLAGEPEAVLKFAGAPEAILLCHYRYQQQPHEILSDGFRVVVRDRGGAERAFRTEALDCLTTEQAGNLMDAIDAGTGLPTNMLVRQRMLDGSLKEYPWALPVRSGLMRSVFVFLDALCPFVCGAIVGLMWPHGAIAALVGIAVCGFQLLKRICSHEAFLSGAALARAVRSVLVRGSAYAVTYAAIAYR